MTGPQPGMRWFDSSFSDHSRIAQLEEHATDNREANGSNPFPATMLGHFFRLTSSVEILYADANAT